MVEHEPIDEGKELDEWRARRPRVPSDSSFTGMVRPDKEKDPWGEKLYEICMKIGARELGVPYVSREEREAQGSDEKEQGTNSNDQE